MTLDRNQSDIRETRDQLFLDYADGDRLNVVGSNLGINRPAFGFQDDDWRAIVKSIALQHKQIRNRFRAVFDILFGPQVTQTTGIVESVDIGDRVVIANDTTGFPQVGTLVVDEGLATEETLEYCFIDRPTNAIYVSDTAGFQFAHTVVDSDAEQPLLLDGGTTLSVGSARDFPTTGFPYVVTVGRGTPEEEVAEVAAVDQIANTITLAAPLSNTHDAVTPSIIFDQLFLPYATGSTFIVLNDTTQFKDSGLVYIAPQTGEFEVLTGTVNNLTVAGGTFISDVHNGYYVRFVGNVTPALAGVEVLIDDNTASVVTFASPLGTAPSAGDLFHVVQAPFNAVGGSSTTVTVNGGTFTNSRQIGNTVIFDGNVTSALEGIEAQVISNTDAVLTFPSALPATPVSGDTFRIRPIVEYTTNDFDNSALTIHLPVFDLLFPAGAKIERLDFGSTVTVGQLQVKGSDWDIFEVTPRMVDVFLPSDLLDIGDLRSASYLHTNYIDPAPSTTLSSAASAGDASLDVASDADFPVVGVVLVGGLERVGYYKDGSGSLILATQLLANAFSGGSTVELYQPRYGVTDLLIGDPFNVADTFPGPYVYSPGSEAPTGTVALTELVDLLPGPTTIEMDQIPTSTALEVRDATAFDLVNFPYNTTVGRDTGNRETVEVNDVNLKARVAGVVAAAGSGQAFIEVTSLTGGGAPDAANFPDASGYRVRISNGEIVYVTGTSATPTPRLLLQNELVAALSGGETLSLVSDVLTVSALADFHEGKVSYGKRSTAVAGMQAAFPSITQTDISSSEIVEPEIASLDVASATGLDVTGGTLVLNYGSSLLRQEDALAGAESAGATDLEIADSSVFPVSYPYVIVVNPGHLTLEERHLVTDNIIAANRLVINGSSFGLKNAQPAGTPVVWEPGAQETIEYDSVSGNTLSFSPAIVLQSTHSPTELVIDTSVSSAPRGNGFDYPFKMLPDIRERIEFLFDLIRAAGVQVRFIEAR